MGCMRNSHSPFSFFVVYKQKFIVVLHRILNYSVLNYSRQGKLRRLWRLAVATQPPIADCLSGSAPRNPQLLLD